MTPSARNRWMLLAGGLLLALLVAAWLLWFFQNFERAERNVRSGLSAEARRNAYLAAERYLARLGYGVEATRDRSWLKSPPESPGALVVSNPGPDLPPAAEQRLLDWVAVGGHLVLTPRRAWNADGGTGGHGIVERLGARLQRRPSRPEETPEGTPAGPGDARGIVDVAAVGTSADVAFDRALYLEDTAGAADRRIDGEHGAHLLSWRRGAGRITLLSDDGFMRNERIGLHDHAWFLSHLLRDQQQVWLLVDASVPPLTTWLWRQAPGMVVSVVLLGLIMLWRAARTHGPRLRAGDRVRRNIIEHLGAAAAYAWRRDRGRGLLDGSRQAVESVWNRRYPGLRQMARQDRCEWIAERTGLTRAEVAATMFEEPEDEQSLVRVSNLQQQLIGRDGGSPR